MSNLQKICCYIAVWNTKYCFFKKNIKLLKRSIGSLCITNWWFSNWFCIFGTWLYRTWVSVKRIILTFRMNGSPAMSIICLESDLILRTATKNPTTICDVVKQHCGWSAILCFNIFIYSKFFFYYLTLSIEIS